MSDKNASVCTTRRGFIGGSLAAAATIAGAATVARAAEPEADWTAEADVVIVGSGLAGLSAAAVIGLEDLGTSLVLEAAPEEMRGGNSSVSGGIVFCPDSKEAALEYQSALNGPYSLPQDVFEAWAEEIVQNVSWLTDNFGATYVPSDQKNWGKMGEFPLMPRADECKAYVPAENTTWGLVAQKVDELGVPCYYDTRAVELVTNDAGEVIGVKSEDGRLFKANKGVLLACGGFEHNPEMMALYGSIAYPNIAGKGTWYNRGDGIKMAQRLGAQLWHMNNFSGSSNGMRCLATDEVDSRTTVLFKTNHFLYLDARGQRFMDEDLAFSGCVGHGKMYKDGMYTDYPQPAGSWMVFDQTEFEAGPMLSGSTFAKYKGVDGLITDMQGALDAGILVRCEDYAELAAAMGPDEDVVKSSIEQYNLLAEANDDVAFGRGKAKNVYGELLSDLGHENDELGRDASVLEPLAAPFYVTPYLGCIYNTQGGPKRSANCEVLDVDDKPIPRLYAAGEMGCEYPYIYNVGGNVSEAISSGRRAGRVICGLDPVA